MRHPIFSHAWLLDEPILLHFIGGQFGSSVPQHTTARRRAKTL